MENFTPYDKNFRFRASYRKIAEMRFLTHLELASRIRLAMLEAGIPVSVGRKNSQPQISLGPALPMNVESRGEWIDFFAYRYCSPVECIRRINSVLPPQLHFNEMVPISKAAPSLSSQINGADYSLDLATPENSGVLAIPHEQLIRSFMEKDEVLITKFKSGKIVNIRQFVRSLEYDRNRTMLWIEMDITGGVTAGIAHVIHALYGTQAAWRICRERLYIREGTQKKSPLTLEWEQIQLQRHMMDMFQ
jgi:radical SAM-linked protein